MEQSYRDPDNPGVWERIMQRRTGMTRAQRMEAKKPGSAELIDFTFEEMEAWREGENWQAVDPPAIDPTLNAERARQRHYQREGTKDARRSQRQPG